VKNKKLLDMMSDIEDSFIEEAAHPEILLKKKRKSRFLSASKIGTLAACMVIAVGMVVAVPYMRVSKEDAIDYDPMNSAIQAAINTANKPQDDEVDALASAITTDNITQDTDKAAQEAEALKKAQEEAAAALKAAEAASKAAQDAAQKAKAEAASKAAQEEAAKAKAEAEKASAGASQAGALVTSVSVLGPETTKNTAETIFSQFADEKNGITFVWYDHVLYDAVIYTDQKLVDLIIPETLSGEPIVEIADAFWDFTLSHQELKTITIPDTIEKFGDISALEKSVVIICSVGSPAAEFFAQAGYSVQSK